MNNIKEKSPKKDYAIALFGVFIIIVAVILMFQGCTKVSAEEPASPASVTYDPDAVSGGWGTYDVEAITDELNKKVNEGMINISMNTSPYADIKDGICNFMIVNEEINNYPQKVTVSLNSTGEVIYESGLIPVGSKIEKAVLKSLPPVGEYECTAMFSSVDPEGGNVLGSAGAVIRVTIYD